MPDIKLTPQPTGKHLVKDLAPGTLFLLDGSAILMKLTNGVVNMSCLDYIGTPGQYDDREVVKVIAKQKNATIHQDFKHPIPRERKAGDLPPGGWGVDKYDNVWFRPCNDPSLIMIEPDTCIRYNVLASISERPLVRWYQGPVITPELFEEGDDA
jgi:hypothetical protein